MNRSNWRLLSEFPEVVAQWHPTKNNDLRHTMGRFKGEPLRSDKLVEGSKEKVWWKCPVADDHEWEISPNSRTGPKKSGCPCCSIPSMKLSVTNRLDTLHPDIAAEWHPTKNEKGPHEYFEMSNSKVWWLCPDCENEYPAWITNRVNVESGCPSCHGGSLHSDGRNSLAAIAPHVAAEWHPTKNEDLIPADVTSKSQRKVGCYCDKGPDHEWSAVIGNRSFNGATCPCCANKKLSITNCH